VKCVYYDKHSSTDDTVDETIAILKEAGRIKEGDIVVNTGSMPLHKRLRTNMLKVTIVD
jgi:pyruvate kinase